MRTILILASCCLLSVVVFAEDSAPNLVDNPGFETAGDSTLPKDWSGPTKVFSVDTSVAHSGKASLKAVNADAGFYPLCHHPMKLESGRIYEISAWVKTQGVQGEESGATICTEFYGKDGKYISGCYPVGLKGDNEWTLVKGVTGRVPEGVNACSFTCYLRKGITGTAWWDDVSATLVRERPLSSVLVVPNYRAMVTDGGPKNAVVRAFLNLRDYELNFTDTVVEWSLVDKDSGEEKASGSVGTVVSDRVTVEIPARRLTPGNYEARIRLKERLEGTVLAEDRHGFKRIEGRPKRTAYIDEHNRLMLNGEPFFPLGMYWGSVSKEELDIYADSVFNCLMPYGSPNAEQMDLIHDHGLKAIYSVKDTYFGTGACVGDIKSQEDEYPFVRSKIEAFRNHPALLAWYINDELSLDLLDRLSAHRQWNEDLDPDHPAWVVLYQVDQVRQYMPSFDVIGTDPYPIPQGPPSRAGDYARKTRDAVAGARAVWMVPQTFNWANYKKDEQEKKEMRMPTLDEMRSMAWQCIAEGANGLVFYSWFDLRRCKDPSFDASWKDVKTVAQEIGEMIPILLSVEKSPRVDVEARPWLHSAVKRVGRTAYVILVNDSREAQVAQVNLGKPFKTLARHAEGKPVSLDKNKTVSVQLPPLGVEIIELR